MRRMLWFVLLCFPVSCWAPEQEAPSSVPFEEFLKIDVHSHIFADSPKFVEMMDRTNPQDHQYLCSGHGRR